MTQPAPAYDPMAHQPVAEPAAFPSTSMHRIWRPGARPLVFSGTELAMAMSFTPELPYWYEVNVYRTDTQGFVLAVRLFFQSEDEADVAQAWSFDTIDEVFTALEAYDAGKDVRVTFDDVPGESPADLLAHSMALRAQVAAARAHFASLIGEFFNTLDQAEA